MTVLEQANVLSLVFALPPHSLIIFQSTARPNTKTLSGLSAVGGGLRCLP